jgi:hypothetical protein
MHERNEILRTIRQEEWKIMNNCNEIYGACRHKTRFHRFLKEHSNVKNTSTDEGNKPEKVYKKYENRDGLSDSDDSQETSPRPARVSDVIPPPGALDVCMLILPSMCMIIVQQASRLTTTRQPNRELGGSR